MKNILTKDESFWLGLLKKYLIDGKCVVIRAVPSIEEEKRMAKVEVNRIEQQRRALGAAGLAKKAEELKTALATNSVPPPKTMLTEFSIPDITEIKSLPSAVQERGNIKTEGNIANLDLEKFPVHVTACNINSAFAYVRSSRNKKSQNVSPKTNSFQFSFDLQIMVYFNTHTISPELRPYLTLFLELLTESPIRRTVDDLLIPYEDVQEQLQSDTVWLDKYIDEKGSQFMCGSFSQTARFFMLIDYRKYNVVIQLIIDLLNHTVFNVDRIRACAAKSVSAVPHAKRRGRCIVADLIDAMFYVPQTNIRVCSLIHQERFLNALIEDLNDTEKATKIIDDLNRLRSELVSTQRLGLYIAADWKKVLENGENEQYATWNKLIRSDDVFRPEHFEDPISDYKLRKSIVSNNQILGLDCVEHVSLTHVVSCPIELNNDAHIPLELFIEYLQQLRGPFCRQALYNYYISVESFSQLIRFEIHQLQVSDVVATFEKFKSIVETLLADSGAWDAELLESAKNALIFSWMQSERCVNDLAAVNFTNCCLLKTDPISDVNQSNIRKLKNVTIQEIEAAANKYVKPLFTSLARTAIVCPSDKVAKIRAEFKG